MGEIVNDLLQSLKVHLQNKMIDDIPSEYESLLTYTDKNDVERILAPSQVLIGALRDDPTVLPGNSAIPSLHVAIHPNDPNDTSYGWKHDVATGGNLGMVIENPYEVGGDATWWRRFVVTFKCFFVDSDQTQEEACRLANAVRGTLEKYCDAYRRLGNTHGWQCGATQDVFNETAIQSHVAKTICWESGGPSDDYIWEGAVWIQVRTERD